MGEHLLLDSRINDPRIVYKTLVKRDAVVFITELDPDDHNLIKEIAKHLPYVVNEDEEIDSLEQGRDNKPDMPSPVVEIDWDTPGIKPPFAITPMGRHFMYIYAAVQKAIGCPR
jgi:hypothetical protein